MESRAVIDQAKGILMARDRCTADDPLEVLKPISQNHNVKLRAIAQAIVEAVQKWGTERDRFCDHRPSCSPVSDRVSATPGTQQIRASRCSS